LIVLGIDPGLSLTGWGVVEARSRDDISPIKFGCIHTDTHQTLIQRLRYINIQLQEIIDTYKPDAASIEELFFYKQAKSVAAVGQARGAIVLTIALNNIELYEYNPRTIKISLTGNGSADKSQMQRMVAMLLKLKEIPKPDDAADALAIAMCHVGAGWKGR
jgi:crossover junction endodeoxyribonuclease RuvC